MPPGPLLLEPGGERQEGGGQAQGDGAEFMHGVCALEEVGDKIGKLVYN